VTPCSQAEITTFGGTYCFHLQGRRVSYEDDCTDTGGRSRHLRGEVEKKFLKRKSDEKEFFPGRKCKGEVHCYMVSGSVPSRFTTDSCER
jgi:hypothetical protein